MQNVSIKKFFYGFASAMTLLLLVFIVTGCSNQNSSGKQKVDNQKVQQTEQGDQRNDMGLPPDQGGTPPDMPGDNSGSNPPSGEAPIGDNN